MRKTQILFALLIGVAAASTTLAADNQILTNNKGYNLDMFHPSLFGGNYLAIEDARTLCPWSGGGGLYYDYASRVFAQFKRNSGRAVIFEYIGHVQTGRAVLALGTVDFLSIGVELPVHYLRWRPTKDFGTTAGLPALKSQTYFGDVRAEFKFRALKQEQYWLGMAVAPYITFPSADKNSLMGEGRVTGGGTLVLEHDFGPIDLDLNGGYLYRGVGELLSTKVGDAIRWGAGISHSFKNGLELSGEYWGSDYLQPDTKNIRPNKPQEFTVSVRYRFGANGPRLIVAGDPGVGNGPGTPDYRMIGGIDYFEHTCHACAPKEGQLRVLTVDQNNKPLAAQLAVVDAKSKQSTADSTGEWSAKLSPGAVKVAATQKGYVGAEGQATVTAGQTTTITLMLKEIIVPKPTTVEIIGLDKCTNKQIAIAVTLKDAAGKETNIPVAAAGYKGAMAPGVYNVVAAADGYQPKTAQLTVVAEKNNAAQYVLIRKITLKGTVYFARASHVILPKSYPVLDDAIAQIKNLCDFKKIVIEGHTSSEGGVEYNMGLSKRRAASVVEYLSKHGIDAKVLDSVGYGLTRPVAPNDTEENRSKNRRVEFMIVE